MSVAQVKKQFEELATYLGRDERGLEKLRTLKDAVNTLRTGLASANQKAQDATDKMELAMSASVTAEVDLKEARLEIHRLRQIVENLTHDMGRVSSPATDEDDDSVPKAATHREHRAVMKSLRRHLRTCPKPVNRAKQLKSMVFERASFAKGWSHESLWILGASVALLSAFDGEVTIVSGERFTDMETKTEETARQFVQWFRNNIDFSDSDKDPVSQISKQAVLESNASRCAATKHEQMLSQATRIP